MRFVTDHDVDSAVAAMLRRRGHVAWTVAEAGLTRAKDDALSVYADDRRAALITHDREFTRRRTVEPIGQHVRLRCAEWEAADVLAAHLPALSAILRGRPCVTVVITKDAGPAIQERAWHDDDRA